MGYGQVNVGSAKSSQVISLINYDDTINTNSVKSSNSIRVNTTSTIYYDLFAHSFGGGFNSSITVQGSNDNTTWNDIKTLNGDTKSSKATGNTSGYSYYRLTSRCTGDTYTSRSQATGCLSTSEIIN